MNACQTCGVPSLASLCEPCQDERAAHRRAKRRIRAIALAARLHEHQNQLIKQGDTE